MEENKDGIKHVRRKRYSGTHPKKYSEKYKELNPERYGDIAEHVIEKGSTPAGTHIPIMVEEILQVLEIKPGQSGLDCTLGYGGHSEKILQKLQGSGHLCGLDVDSEQMPKTVKRLRALGYSEEQFSAVHINFANIDQVAEQYGPFDFLLADLGVSSMQIDNPERGFSYKLEGPLDLRLDQSAGVPASERLRELSREEIAGMLIENADEPYAEKIAKAITDTYRKGKKIETTTELSEVIASVLSGVPATERKEAVKKTCARVFQALRIDVNSEYEVLDAFLMKLPGVLKPGGRVAVLTFHSGEDRLVKKAFQAYEREGIFSEVSKDVIRPSAGECARNSRSRSTKLRFAVRS